MWPCQRSLDELQLLLLCSTWCCIYSSFSSAGLKAAANYKQTLRLALDASKCFTLVVRHDCDLCCCCPPGSGRRVGENCEQTWALLKPVTKLTRYMSKRGHREGLDDALLISDDKLQDSVAMVTQHKACLNKLGENGDF